MTPNDLADHRRSLKLEMIRLLNDMETFDLDPVPHDPDMYDGPRIETSAGDIIYDAERGTWKAA